MQGPFCYLAAHPMSHDKGRDCKRTEEVLGNYRRRALAAEAEVIRLRGALAEAAVSGSPKEGPDGR